LSNKSKNSGSKPQGGERSLRKEIRGIVFLLLVIVLGVSLLSFHPADPVFGSRPTMRRNCTIFLALWAPTSQVGFFAPSALRLYGWWRSSALCPLFLPGLAFPSIAKSVTATFCLLLSFAGLLNLYFPQEIMYRVVKSSAAA